jgi:hypothetical protein
MTEQNLLKLFKKDRGSGLTDFGQTLQNMYPNMTDTEIKDMVNLILIQIAKHISDGEQLAFLKKEPDGSINLTVLGFEVLDKKD